MSWESIVGQDRVKKVIRAALHAGRIPHAYLFYGPEGVGKDAMAIELAKVVNCQGGDDVSCGECDSCLKFNSLQHPNLKLVFALPIGKGEKAGDPPLSKISTEDLESVREQIRLKAVNRYHKIGVPRAITIKVNSIRQLKRESSLTAYGKGKKVIIVLDAENMNDESSNALLKTLEEPTKDTLLVLTTSQRDRLLPTIVSRCQGIRFDFLTENAIAKSLERQRGIAPAQAMLVGRLAHGNMSRAFELLETDLQAQRSEVLEFLRTIYGDDGIALSKFVEKIGQDYASDREGLIQFFQVLQFWLRDAFCIREGFASIINIDQSESIERFARKFSRLNYPALLERLDSVISLVNKNAYIPLVVMVLSLEIRKLLSEA